MVRKADLLTARERAAADEGDYDATPIAQQMIQIGDADSEAAWDDWISSLKNSEASGTVRAHRLPVDADGNPMLGKGTRQIYLGSWPHQLYAFDDLLAKITKEFLKPGELAHIKLTGTSPGTRGQMFARIVALQKADGPADGATGSGETIGGLFKVMQDSQQAQLQVMREMMTPHSPVPTRTMMDVFKDVTTLMAPILGPALAAYIARPPLPKSELADLIGAMAAMKDFMSGDSEKSSDESSTVAIVKAVAPAFPELLKLLTQPTAPVQRSNPPLLPRQRPQPTVDLSQPSKPMPSPSPSSRPDDMLAQLAPQIEQLATLAEQKADPVEVAKLTLQMLPEQTSDKLAELVASPDSFARLAMLSPKMQLHAAWFEQLRVALENELYESDTPEAPVNASPDHPPTTT